MSDTGIDGCILKINDLRKNAGELSGLLAPIVDSISGDRFLQRGALEQAAGLMRAHGGLLESLEAEMREVSPETGLVVYGEVLEALEKLKAGSAESAREALEKFQRVKLKIDNPEAQEALAQYRKEALDALKESDVESIIRLAEPYRLFVEIAMMGEIPEEDINKREEVIERKFNRPLPRLLWTQKFFVDEDANNESAGIADDVIVDDHKAILVNPVPKKYSIETKKEGKKFGVREFLGEFDVSYIYKLIYAMGMWRIVAEKQLIRYSGGFPPRAMSLVIVPPNLKPEPPLFRDGYLTLITNNESSDRYYCLSERGCKIFGNTTMLQKIAEYNKPFIKPYVLTTDKMLDKNQCLIEKIISINDLAMFLRYEELPKYCQKLVVYNKEISNEPYAELTLETGANGKLTVLILRSDTVRELSDADADAAAIISPADIVFLYAVNGLADAAGLERRGLLKSKRVYTVCARDNTAKSFDYRDAEGVKREIRDIFGEPVPEVAKLVPVVVKKPDRETPPTFEEGVAEIIALLSKRPADGSNPPERIADAAVLAKALSFIPSPDGDLFKVFYRRLSYAVNMKMDLPVYTSTDIDDLEKSEISISGKLPEVTRKLLRLSTFAWALLLPHNRNDSTLYYKHKFDVLEDAKGSTLALWAVFDVLFSIIEKSLPHGFDFDVVMTFIHKDRKGDQIREIANSAGDMLNYNNNTAPRVNGAPEWYNACLGRGSDLWECMSIIADDKMDKGSFVNEIKKKFDAAASDPIDRYLDEKWAKVKAEQQRPGAPIIKIDRPQHALRHNLSNKVKDRIEIIRKWLAMTGGSNDKTDNIEQIAEVRQKLITEIKAARERIADEFKGDCNGKEPLWAGLAVIDNTFSRICDYLESGKTIQEKWDYAGLYRSHYVNLDNDCLPAQKEEMRFVRGFEPWKRAREHVKAEKREFEEVLKLIDNREEPDWFQNYAAAQNILEKLKKPKPNYTKAIDQAKIDADEDCKTFKSELEFAFSYGRISENMKENIHKSLMDFRGYFFEQGDFAQYRAFRKALRLQIDAYSEEMRDGLKTRYDNLCINDDEINAKVEDYFDNYKLNLVEEFINTIEQYGVTDGVKFLKNEINNDKIETGDDYLKLFLKDYSYFYEICDRYRGRSLDPRVVVEKMPGKIVDNPAKHRTSVALLESWPKGKNSLNRDVIGNFLKNIGFNADKDTCTSNKDNKDKQYHIYTIKVARIPKNLVDYIHPIERFGTGISEPVSVLCFFGEVSPAELQKVFKDSSLGLKDSTFVLTDRAFEFKERQELARRLKSDMNKPNSFLVIDRVLMLYLATLDSSQWLPALLKCTLPYTYCQPYGNEADVVADEMFFGRKNELRTIRDYKGACLVYGGRRLGKTALLKRACSLEHDKASKKIAVFVDVKDMTKADALQAIIKQLAKHDINVNAGTTAELCDALENKLRDNTISKLQLYIDEADRFLDEMATDNYKDLEPFRRLRLESDYSNRFKVVFAGLHKVVHNKENSVILQMGKPLCIKPFTQQEAKKIVETPLAYLGFHFGEKDGESHLSMILANTNYYPGLLQLYCRNLVDSISENYADYCNDKNSDPKDNPPFVLRAEHLRKIIANAGLNDQIKIFFNANLELDARYKHIANIIAWLSYKEFSQDGFSLNEIKNYYDDFPLPPLVSMTRSDLEILLSEMVEMGILFNKKETENYRLKRSSFLEMLGSKEQIELEILTASDASEGQTTDG